MIYVGGQDGVDEAGVVVSSDVADQSVCAVDTVETALAAAGASLAEVISWNVLIRRGAL